jgi:hypothetical protein
MVETVFKKCIRETLSDVFESWSCEHTQLFNKGVDKALSGIQWVVYPDRNVAMEAGEGDWSAWLHG